MASYKTCFTPEWCFYRVFECESEVDSHILEQSVLYCLASRRVHRRELLYSLPEEVSQAAEEIAKALNMSVVIHPHFDGCTARKEKVVVTQKMNDARCVCLESSSESLSADQEDPWDDISSRPPKSANAEASWVLSPSKPSPERATGCSPHTIPESEDISAAMQMISPYVSALDQLIPRIEKNFQRIAQSSAVAESTVLSSSPACNSGEDDVWITASDFLSPETREKYFLHSLRPYQKEAVKRLRSELLKSGKAICQMACRCGKTPVAYSIIREYLSINSNASSDSKERGKKVVLYLVPGLSLLRQTVQKLFQYGVSNKSVDSCQINFLLIGSHPDPVECSDTVSYTMTTDLSVIEAAVEESEKLVIISTYHSSALLSNVHSICSLVVFDECHRVCGSVDATNFNALLFLPPVCPRLFLTATPTYDTPLKMSDESLFGGIAYRFYLREGIDGGYVNPFGVRVILGESLENMNPYLLEAMKMVDKLLVFARDIRHAEKMYDALKKFLRGPRHSETGIKEGSSPPNPGEEEDVPAFECFLAHSQMGNMRVSDSLAQFTAAKRAVLFNVRLFQEGVEIPDLNAVFFATPRYSSRDIIQSICRPLNKLEGKPMSYVMLPGVMNKEKSEFDPVNLANFSTLVPFTDALIDEDPTLFEYMIDPKNKQYNFSVVGVRSLALSSERIQQFVLPAIRRGVRYSSRNSDRLARATRLPWKCVFAELKRVVVECNRYPKTNDAWVVGSSSLSLYRFYQFCRKGYYLYLKKQPTYLQIHQIRDLESLPMWERYGLYGPYPWNECFESLKSLLQWYGSCPPLDVHKGGYVGLDATPLERLCGFLMHINQCDAKLGLRLSPAKQQKMDELCKEFPGLRWRKQRDKAGVVLPSGPPTFITTSFKMFKKQFAELQNNPQKANISSFQQYLDKYFPGYPEKHIRMERLDSLLSGSTPPRYNPAVRRATAVNPLSDSYSEKQKSAKDVTWDRSKKPMNCPTSADFSVADSSTTSLVSYSSESSFEKNVFSSDVSPITKVMCRICRHHIAVMDWEAHLRGETHLTALQKFSR